MDNILGFEPSLVVSIVALIFGIIILIAPKFLNYLVAIYLIIIGVIGLWPHVTGSAPADSTTTTQPSTL